MALPQSLPSGSASPTLHGIFEDHPVVNSNLASKAISQDFSAHHGLQSITDHLQPEQRDYNQGLEFLKFEQYAEALQCFDRVLACNDQDANVWHARGDALANLHRYEEALGCFERAIALQSDVAESWIFRSIILIHLERYVEALESCDRALALDPENSESWLFRASALQRLGRYQEAYACFDRAAGNQRKSIRQRLTQMVSQFSGRKQVSRVSA